MGGHVLDFIVDDVTVEIQNFETFEQHFPINNKTFTETEIDYGDVADEIRSRIKESRFKMLVESFNPFNNMLISAIVAAVPIILFLLCLTVFKMKGVYAALTTLIVTALVSNDMLQITCTYCGRRNI